MLGLSGESLNLTEYNLDKLKEIFPEVFCEGKIDFDKLRLLLGDNIEDKEERYEFTWNGKSDAIRIAQTPSTGTLRPDKESSKNWNDTENLYIEGDNLEVLKSLQKSYFGKVKMIYIDPPYNTGRDFIYKDNFRDSIDNYKEITNQTTKANSETNGRYHTYWLNMMYPRLRLARNLLTEDGVIFISIDNNEVTNLNKICDEIFGEYNKLGIMSVVNNLKGRSDDKFFATSNEFLLVYAKKIDLANINGLPMDDEYEKEYKYKDNISNYKEVGLRKTGKNSKRKDRPNMYYPIYFNIDTNEIYTEKKNHYNEVEIYPLDENGDEGCWRWGKETFNEKKDTEIIVKLNNNNKWCVYVKMRDIINGEKRTQKPKTTWINPKYDSGNGTKLIKELFNDNIFTNPKPIEFILDILRISTDSNSLVLDFFSGSATTSQAIMRLNSEDNGNRKFIMVQLPELIERESEAYKAGYKNICEIGKERIRRSGDKILSENKDKEGIKKLDIGFKVFKLDSSNLKSWDSSIEDLEQNILEMDTNLKKDRSTEDLLYEILLKSGVELTAKIEEIKVGYNTLYNIGEGALLACLDDKITQDVIDEIPKHKSPFMETKVIFKEAGFMSDAAKINAIQNLKQFKIEDVRSV
jgi:adenine-specific DNA-methyltransferase|nr:site-specific DNA-methyltransferase [uncultured Romboutsia sp.]